MGQKNGNPFLITRQKGLGDTKILLVPRKMVHSTTKDFHIRKLCLESTGKAARRKGEKEVGRKHGLSLAPSSHILNLMGERGIYTKYLENYTLKMYS